MIFFFLFIASSSSRSLTLFSSSYSQEVTFTFYADQSITCLNHYFPWASRTSPFRLKTSLFRTKKMKDGRVGILLSDLIHLPFSCASNSGNVRQVFQGPKLLKKRYFTLKQRSHKNSYVLTGKLAPKEEAWKSLQWAVNFQTS